MSQKSLKTQGPGRRLTGKFKVVSDLTSKLAGVVEEIEELIDENKESTGVLFEVEKGKPVVIAVGPDGEMSTQPLSELIDGIGDHGGGTYTPEDIREIEIWVKAFRQAAKTLSADLRSIRANPRKY